MRINLITFANRSMSISAQRCVESAELHGVDQALIYPHGALRKTEFYSQNRELLESPRGCGYWAWKPFVILEEMSGLSDGDFLIYSDAGITFIDNVRYIIDRMDQDVFLFGNQWQHAHWCKRDVIDAIDPLGAKLNDLYRNSVIQTYGAHELSSADMAWEGYGKQVQASVIGFRVTEFSRAFVAEWLHWCVFEGGRLIDDSPSIAANHSEFQENRHDQAILTTLAYRARLKLHWWPAIYNDGAFTYEKGDFLDDYPPLVHHHRRRNYDWETGR